MVRVQKECLILGKKYTIQCHLNNNKKDQITTYTGIFDRTSPWVELSEKVPVFTNVFTHDTFNKETVIESVPIIMARDMPYCKWHFYEAAETISLD